MLLLYLITLPLFVISTPDITGDNVLDFAQTAIQSLTQNEEFTLDSKWRNSNGNLRAAKIEQRRLQTQTVPQCTNVDGDGSVGSLSYQYSFDASDFKLCLYLEGDFGVIDVNYDSDKRAAKVPSVSFGPDNNVLCEDCYAYIGAIMKLRIVCDADIDVNFDVDVSVDDIIDTVNPFDSNSDRRKRSNKKSAADTQRELLELGVDFTVDASASCSVEFSAGGGIDINAELSLEDPNFLEGGSAVLEATPSGAPNNIEDSYYKYLATTAVNGFDVAVAQAMHVDYNGVGSASGSAMFKAKFETTADYYLSVNTAGSFTQSFSSDVQVEEPVLWSQLSMDDISTEVDFTVKPTLFWKIGFSVPSGRASTFLKFQTPFELSYGYTQVEETTSTAAVLSVMDQAIDTVWPTADGSRRLGSDSCGFSSSVLAEGTVDSLQLNLEVDEIDQNYGVSASFGYGIDFEASSASSSACLSKSTKGAKAEFNKQSTDDEDDWNVESNKFMITIGVVAGVIALIAIAVLAVVRYRSTSPKRADASATTSPSQPRKFTGFSWKWGKKNGNKAAAYSAAATSQREAIPKASPAIEVPSLKGNIFLQNDANKKKSSSSNKSMFAFKKEESKEAQYTSVIASSSAPSSSATGDKPSPLKHNYFMKKDSRESMDNKRRSTVVSSRSMSK